MKHPTLSVLILSLLLTTLTEAQEQSKVENPRTHSPKLYLDCIAWCDEEFIKSEISLVNYVREPFEADIHLTITSEFTSSGGLEYTLKFLGFNQFENLDFSLKPTFPADATDEEIRSALTEKIKQGLIPFLAQTPMTDYISVFYEWVAPDSVPEVTDKWKNWVFSIYLYTSNTGSNYNKSIYFSNSVEAKKITEKYKFWFLGSIVHNESLYEYGDYKLRTVSRSYSTETFYARCMNNHVSLGAWLNYYTSKFSNIEYRFSLIPALEYNIFPYSEYADHEFTFQFKISNSYVDYYEETIYSKLDETLFKQSLELYLSSTKHWGSTWLSMESSKYLHDFSKDRLTFSAGISIRVISGLSFNVSARYSSIHDQLALQKGNVSEEDLLTLQREMEKDYDYSLSFGLNYYFGTIYSNIVNPIF